jgi:hypothetical protein
MTRGQRRMYINVRHDRRLHDHAYCGTKALISRHHEAVPFPHNTTPKSRMRPPSGTIAASTIYRYKDLYRIVACDCHLSYFLLKAVLFTHLWMYLRSLFTITLAIIMKGEGDCCRWPHPFDNLIIVKNSGWTWVKLIEFIFAEIIIVYTKIEDVLM